MDPGETIVQAVEREVYEETGVRTHFEGIIGFREMLDARYTASDFYFVCLMTLSESESINIIDKREIFEARWVPLSELTSNEEGVTKYRMFPNAWKFMSSLQFRINQSKG